jgi:hypothetical protein
VNRYGVLTRTDRVKLVVVYLVAQPVAWLFFDGLVVRISIAVLTLAVLAVMVTTRRRTSK